MGLFRRKKDNTKVYLAKIFQAISETFIKEVSSRQGKANIALSALLVLIIVFYLIITSAEHTVVGIARAICGLESPSQHNNILGLVLIFFMFSLACLVFLYITIVNERNVSSQDEELHEKTENNKKSPPPN